MNKITAIITFRGDISVGLPGATYTMELPDFREITPDYTEANRKTIKQFYGELRDEGCHVVFSFETTPTEKQAPILPIEDKTFSREEIIDIGTLYVNYVRKQVLITTENTLLEFDEWFDLNY